jgi:PRTRC genetic system protein E
MTMFEELYALAVSVALTMTVSADEKSGRLTINVIPKPRKEASEPALAQPLSLTATPQEFDAGFLDALRGYREVHQTLEQQAEATKEVLEAAKAASVKKAGEASAKVAAGKASASAGKPASVCASSAAAAAPASADGDDAGQTRDDAGTPAAAGNESFDLFG